MGRMQADEMAHYADEDTALIWHLRCNHFPPVPAEMLEPCKQAIHAVSTDEWDELIPLPEGITYQGDSEAPAWAIVEAHHLDSWVDYGDVV